MRVAELVGHHFAGTPQKLVGAILVGIQRQISVDKVERLQPTILIEMAFGESGQALSLRRGRQASRIEIPQHGKPFLATTEANQRYALQQ